MNYEYFAKRRARAWLVFPSLMRTCIIHISKYLGTTHKPSAFCLDGPEHGGKLSEDIMNGGTTALTPWREAARYLIHKSGERGISSVRLNKLIYFAHGWTLGHTGEPLIDNNETIKAWEDGPVIPDLYHKIKYWGSRFARINTNDYNRRFPNESISDENIDRIDEQVKKILDWVMFEYKGMNDYDLIELSHEKGGPWDKSRERRRHSSPPIKDEDIRTYFASQI